MIVDDKLIVHKKRLLIVFSRPEHFDSVFTQLGVF